MVIAKLLNRDRTIEAVLEQATVQRLSRAKNQAGEVRLTVPVGDPKLSAVDIAKFIEVTRGGERVVMEVSDRQFSDTDVTISGYTEEVLLKEVVCPQNYSSLYRNLDLADFARDIVRGYHVVRVASQPQFATKANGGLADELYQVDINSYPNRVILDNSNGSYYPTGFIRLEFDAQDIPNFVSWERFRYLGGHDDVVSTNFAYRFLDSNRNETASFDYAAPIQADTRGTFIGNYTDRYLQVSILMITSDTTTPDNPDNPTIKGVTPVLEGVEVIARTATELAASPAIPAAFDAIIGSLNADQTNGLVLLREACEQLGYAFRVRDGVLEVAQSFGSDRSEDFVLVG